MITIRSSSSEPPPWTSVHKVGGSNPLDALYIYCLFFLSYSAVESLNVREGLMSVSRWTVGLRRLTGKEWQLLDGWGFDPKRNIIGYRMRVAATTL